MDTQTLIEQHAEAWVRAVKKAEAKIKAEEEEAKIKAYRIAPRVVSTETIRPMASQKRKQKKERKGNRSPSGFVKPTLISDELASFLGKDKGTEMARTEVTREINAYIRANQLQDKTNGRRIIADIKLSSLLKLASGDELTYFNLQRYMSPHFTKTAAAVASA